MKDETTSRIPGGSDRGGGDTPEQPGSGPVCTDNARTQAWLQTADRISSDGRGGDYNADLLRLYSTDPGATPPHIDTIIDGSTRAHWAQLTVEELSELKWAVDKRIKIAAICCFGGLLLVIVSIHMLHRIYGMMMKIIAETYPDDGPMPADVRGHKRK